MKLTNVMKFTRKCHNCEYDEFFFLLLGGHIALLDMLDILAKVFSD